MAQCGEWVGVDEIHQIAYLFAIVTGIVSSGAIGSLWAALTDEAPSFKMLTEGDYLTPIKAPVFILSGPTTLIVNSFWWIIERPLVGIAMLFAGLAWSFVQGVFILTQFFGAV
jgi:vacuolar-type H+-ATPase subunit I/STV1